MDFQYFLQFEFSANSELIYLKIPFSRKININIIITVVFTES